MTLTLGFSPCPNDTFIFDALVNGRVDTGGLRFEPVLEDVQTLNRWALEGRLDVSKVSYGVLPLVTRDYVLLGAGGALGRGVGPLLVARPDRADFHAERATVAIPGEHTTAHLLFSLACPHVAEKRFLVFSEIERAVLAGEVDAGVIIHEGRFTYQAKGLVKLLDLGEHWEAETGSPIPLGGIVARRGLGAPVAREVDRLIRRSAEQALAAYPLVTPYVQRHAQEMDEAVMRQHIQLYVNDFSVEMGEGGRKAVRRLLEVYARTRPATALAGEDVFLEG
ncbi:1,4-dihydroxy-6-naphthoate synthase [Anaeromyxobacter diazotrophicus]|uniref:1,4-dihydroxy-6-naphtoate synthase n=1 Tax=Anaeromyxobacter diazotrophicus TaxID=2590199 RepID=A0A7I9VS95_9BACT|nr:1,4-dihydroxy-6-naphthoate synthase [Anaeromyxobacter diazotrophicus]GEJ58959.1 1,4-dihydroxy-6-naphtoate synthase [Anaeromyxobacter diazotrophicus]